MSDELGVNIEGPAPTRTAKAPVKPAGLPETVKIILEESDNIPPTGLYLGFNGRGYLIRPGAEVNIPLGVKEILDHAVMSVPQVDPNTQRVSGYRERLRYPYRRVG